MPVLIERERPSKEQLKAIQAYIMRRRLKERQALAESRAKEEAEKQRKREQEKKEETVEDVKMEISKLESKLESLKNEKHQLFLQLKKVLNEDEEKRQKVRQASVMVPPQSPHPMMSGNVHRMPYGMMGPRPFGIAANVHNVQASQPMAMAVVPTLPMTRVDTPVPSASVAPG
jgi:G protein pathway suppressor 2